ncbi:receptor-type tyrosine-protein phosphatase T [Elysia marginata]|uniref:Receptor-type tyrosine-protein phosphatase T n=1 Tax=Elysia marginata TaxID=1093978 RepID=A0AAV4H1M6_9GAST|nr:receptor-type tyrosine-protein phosphatase T [Elysia marginata]
MPQNVLLATMEKDVEKLAVNIVLVTEMPVIISLVVVIKDVILDIEALTAFRFRKLKSPRIGNMEECTMGHFGDGCRENCSEHCAGYQSACNHISGICYEGCDPGYQGLLCKNECNATMWGQDCAKSCSARCLHGTCQHVTGLCAACTDGYWGDFCDQACKKSTFGAQCNQVCSVNCVDRQCHHVNGTCNQCVESRTGDFCETSKQAQSGGDDSTTGAILGVLVVIVIILAIAAAVLFRRRHKIFRQYQEESGVYLKERVDGTAYANVPPETSNTKRTDRQSKRSKPARTLTIRRKDGFEEESPEDTDDEMAGNAKNDILAGETAVLVENLKAYIQQHSTGTHFKDEFSSIPMANSSPQTCGLSPENIKKNRYKNIIPYDASRVLLKTLDGKKHSDYINASYVKGYETERAFIASQGPNDFILDDFVRMLWEQKVDRVVMLTNLVELGKVSEKFADFIIIQDLVL